MKYKRIFLIVLESLGIGATNDSDKYGDGSSNTLMHAVKDSNIDFPNLKAMGLFQLLEESDDKTVGYYTKAIPTSDNKNTFINYQEMMGNVTIGEKKLIDLENIDKDLFNYIESEIDRRLIISPKDSDINIINKYGVNHIKSAIEGDSAFGFSGMDFSTICRFKLPVTVVIFNNGGIYNGIGKPLDNTTDPAPTTLDINARYDKLGEAFGAKTYYVTTPDELASAFKEAIASKEPSLIDVQLAADSGKESGHIGYLNPAPLQEITV